jgi:predicted enzyme related to lactoylglutathione lyase
MNPVIHFEIPYRDADRASAFYAKAFGWKATSLGPRMGNYIVVVTAEEDVVPEAPGGAINGGLYPVKEGWPHQYPSIVIGVDDLALAMDRVRTAGGTLLGEPMRIPQVGDYVAFLDTEGNRGAMLQPKPRA